MPAARPPEALLRRAFAGAFRACRAAVFPARCLECRDFMAGTDREGAGEEDVRPDAVALLRPFFCAACLRGVMPLDSPLCPRCGIMFKGRSGEDHLCGHCREQPPGFLKARAAFVYDRSLVDVIHCLKYKGKLQLAAPLGRLLHRTFVHHWGGERIDAILPVPLHGRRLRSRGFNQSELLVRGWKEDPAGAPAPPILAGVLRRVRATVPQAGLGRRDRESNIHGAFAVRRPEAVADRHLLLVDDVVTTGATAAEAARVLLKSGAGRVDVLALARVI
jgi:ComF family protein